MRQRMEHSGFAVLLIVLSYFEMIAKYQEGYTEKNKSEDYFRKGVYSVFPTLATGHKAIAGRVLNILYHGARCGLYHIAAANPKIALAGDACAPMIFDSSNSRLTINPHRLVPTLKAHFDSYVAQLRDPNNVQLRRNFERRFDTEP